MQKFSYTVKDSSGIHARPAAMMTNCCCKFSSEVVISVGERVADGKDVLAVMSLYAKQGEEVQICINGSDEIETMHQLQEVLRSIEQL